MWSCPELSSEGQRTALVHVCDLGCLLGVANLYRHSIRTVVEGAAASKLPKRDVTPRFRWALHVQAKSHRGP